jgi:hypothetical protein
MSALPQDHVFAGADRPQLYVGLVDHYPEVVFLTLSGAFQEDVTTSLIRRPKMLI